MSINPGGQDLATTPISGDGDGEDEKSEEYDIKFKIILVGNTQVGKTAILTRFCDNEFRDISITTIGIDYRTQVIEKRGKKVKLAVWDTAGQERFRTLVSSYYRGAAGIFVVYDVTSQGSFRDISLWLNEISKFCPEGTERVIVGNKADLTERRQVTKEDGEARAKELGMEHFEISAKTGMGVNEMFDKLTEMLMDNPEVLKQMKEEDDYHVFIQRTGDEDETEDPEDPAEPTSPAGDSGEKPRNNGKRRSHRKSKC